MSSIAQKVKEDFLDYYKRYHSASWTSSGVEGKVDYCFQEQGKTLYILFRQTTGKFDWFCDFFFFPTSVVPYKNMHYEFKVHRGFWLQFDSVRDEILEQVLLKVKTEGFNQIKIYGWSLGGALAALCKEMLSFQLGTTVLIESLTIGEPRVFCKTKHWSMIKHRFNNHVRVVNDSDVVTHVPPKCFGGWGTPFTHEVEETHVGRPYKWWEVFKVKSHLDSSYKENIEESI